MSPEKIREYLDENPEVYARFKREAFKMIDRGFSHYSARTIMEFLRHNSALEADPTKVFKINNDLIPTLARDFMDDNPDAPLNFFEMRDADVVRAGGKLPFLLEG